MNGWTLCRETIRLLFLNNIDKVASTGIKTGAKGAFNSVAPPFDEQNFKNGEDLGNEDQGLGRWRRRWLTSLRCGFPYCWPL